MEQRRAQKTFRINFWKLDPEFAANVTLFAEPAEVKISASDSTFISVRGGDNKGITIAPGTGASVNLQIMPQNLKYAGMITDLAFPMSLLPSTMATPFPKQIISPPLIKQMPVIKQIAQAAASFVGL